MRSYAGYLHYADRDWRRVPQSVSASASLQSPAPVNLGQRFTISNMLFLPRYGTVHAIWNCSPGGGIRFTVTATGALQFGNGTDSVTSNARVVPIGIFCKPEVTYDGDTRAVVMRVDGETVFTGTLPGTAAFTYTAVTAMTLPTIGARGARLQAWRRPLTQLESRRDFYYWNGPPADVIAPLNNTSTDTRFVPATVDGAAQTWEFAFNTITWSDATPSHYMREPRPFFYGLAAWSNQDGTNPLQIDTRALISAPAMASLRAADKIVLGHWIFFQGAQTQNFRSLYLEQAGSLIGPAIRFDCTTVAGQLRPQINGRLTTAAGAASQIPGGFVNIADRVLGRWAHVAAVIDYVNSTGRILLDGLPLVAPEAFAPTGRYHSDALSGTERYMACALLSTGSPAGPLVRTLQTDHFVAAQAASVDTDAEVRRMVLRGVTPTGTVYRMPFAEGAGLFATDPYGNVASITRDGTQAGAAGTAAAASWRAINAP